MSLDVFGNFPKMNTNNIYWACAKKLGYAEVNHTIQVYILWYSGWRLKPKIERNRVRILYMVDSVCLFLCVFF